MRILFMDTYCLGTFKFLAPYVADKLRNDEAKEIIFLSEHKRRDSSIPGVRHVSIRFPKVPSSNPIKEQITLNAVHQIEAYAHAMQQLKRNGFYPDIVISSEPCSTEVASVFPDACNIVYFDWYYNSLVDDILISRGKLTPSQRKPLHLRNPFQLASLLGVDRAIVSSRLQKESYPTILQNNIDVLPFGVDVEFFKTQTQQVEHNLDKLRPETLPLLHAPELITWLARIPNEYVGFSTVCSAIPRILAARPQSHVVIVTQNVQAVQEHLSFIKLMELAEGRVHLFGQFTWNEYCALLSKSDVHIYMGSTPSLPSSLLEVMSCGALVVASDTRPVREIIEHKTNGMLVDFFNPISVADTVINTLDLEKGVKQQIRANAKTFVEKKYAAQRLVPIHYQLIMETYKKKEARAPERKKQI